MKNLFLLFVLAAALVACNGNTEKAAEPEAENAAMTVVEMNEQMETFVDQDVEVEGTVVHVCTHGGGKMFITDANEEQKMVVFAGESGKFVADELIGKIVRVNGVIEELRMDEAYVAEKEAELEAKIEEHKSETAAVTEDATEEAVEEEGPSFEEKVASNREYLAELRAEIAASENGYLSEYSFKCASYEILGEGELNVAENKCVEDEAEKAKHDHDHEGHEHNH